MSIHHKLLADGRWFQLSLVEQMANIGSEVERALSWKGKKNDPFSRNAFERALELMDFTLGDRKNANRLKEVARVRETIVDYFAGSNEFSSTEASFKKYFYYFAYASRRNR
ncbi:MAG: hypothetical protein NTU66_07275 [Elusimicrobia bacterium]|nr:hypothetical protein [Elusimicrobiota bacterium]